MHIWPILDVPTTQEGKWSEPLRSHPFKIFHSPLMMWTCSTNPWTFQELWATIHTHKIIRSWGQISSQGPKKSQVLILRIVVSLGHAAGPASFCGTACEDIISRPVGSAQTLPGGLSQRHLLGSLSPGGLRAHGECMDVTLQFWGAKSGMRCHWMAFPELQKERRQMLLSQDPYTSEIQWTRGDSQPRKYCNMQNRMLAATRTS